MKYNIYYMYIFMLMLLLSVCDYAYSQSGSKALGLTTVVIDPGHGGKDPGALGQTSSTNEKHIVLSVSKLLGEKIKAAYPGVNVIYTRSSDKFIGLHDRAMVARKNNADLFISIHCNSSRNKAAKGSSVHILGQKSERASNTTDYFEKNMSVAQRENEVIVMEEGYETKYRHFDPDTPEAYIGYTLQWKAHYESSLLFAAEVVDKLMTEPLSPRKIAIDQDIFQVLVEANMPAVLLELAFISNQNEYRYMASKQGQEEIAERLFKAFKSYKSQYDRSLNIESSAAVPPVQPAPAQEVTEGTYYSIQIMSLSRVMGDNDPAFKGLKVHKVKQAGTAIYKYMSGRYASRDEAAAQLSEVRSRIPGAFLVKVEKDKVYIQ